LPWINPRHIAVLSFFATCLAPENPLPKNIDISGRAAPRCDEGPDFEQRCKQIALWVLLRFDDFEFLATNVSALRVAVYCVVPGKQNPIAAGLIY